MLTAKAHHTVRPGDVLTFPLHAQIRIVRILATAPRRGSATVARQLYEDLTPAADQPVDGAPVAPLPVAPMPGQRTPGSGRPSKRDRREIERLRRS
ncbi:MAG: hypothetical protein MUE49_08560 [Rhodospirillales bacterium]|nr:hypothetical protein [Rhodospirillales bacterium]